ncbi:AC19 [Trabala vishnou gigantina nucleopolyhedrovirus]|uniref:AC19 n=1 Tax=Trabala vishnou gigantina nucleopolyhedrovirus TaxID=2863583 RepID=UPI002481B670|nr:AC19 [Trabala vishnou gigantina nucleopolyhedrovirus]QYC92766.1 AC19 [Trabala vishnou gigantina nucleopolyhedrovirus]
MSSSSSFSQLSKTAFMTKNFYCMIKNLLTKSTSVSVQHRKKLFILLCTRFIEFNLLHNNATVSTVQNILDNIVQLELLLWSKSNVLIYMVNFLVANSDGDNLQCVINLKLLDYILNNYKHELYMNYNH